VIYRRYVHGPKSLQPVQFGPGAEYEQELEQLKGSVIE
jgi:hypothetical protein